MNQECEHDKVYADYVLTSNPPQYPWICSKCGEKGTDRASSHKGLTYKELIEQFKGKGAQ